MLGSSLTPSAAMLALALALAHSSDQEPETRADDTLFFEQSIRPVLEDNCFRCHGGGERLRGGLDLTTRAGLARGGDTGSALDASAPASSLLLRMVRYEDEDHQMPPDGPLEPEQVALLTEWVARGAPYGAPRAGAEGAEHDGVQAPEEGPRLAREDGLSGWAWRPRTRPQPPEVRRAGGVAHPLDAFVQARLEAAGLEPAPLAERAALLRRVTYDLTGLPPTPEETAAFVADGAPGAYARVVDRLLASPHYGEHWGRHWLDLVRYAETNGYERDTDKPYMWRYRDWVVDALNADLPYDRFVLQQLAGDELDEPTPASLTATGYYRLMQWDDEPGQGALQARYDTLDDIASTTASVFLGMSLGCARCHDHMADPLPQEDYYRFVGFFHGVTDMSVDRHLRQVLTPAERAERERIEAEVERDAAPIVAELAEFEEALRARLARLDRGASASAPPLADLRYRFYRGEWPALPAFDALRPEDEGALPGGRIELSPATRDAGIGFVFEGRLELPSAGAWSWAADGVGRARLTLGDALVLEGDLPLAAEVAHGSGPHALRLDYASTGAASALRLSAAPARRATWAYTTEPPPPEWTERAFDASAWSRGSAGFGREGTPGAALGTEWTTNDIWLVRDFEWTRPADALRLALHHDDDVQVWIDGALAFEAGGAWDDYRAVAPRAAALAGFAPGVHRLAVHCASVAGGQYVDVVPIAADALGDATPTDLALGRVALTPAPGRARALSTRELFDRHADLLDAQDAERKRDLERELATLRARPRPARPTPTVQERGARLESMYVHVRGNAAVPGARVEPGWPRCVDPREPDASAFVGRGGDEPTSGARRALAEWIASPDNPLTARVVANRLWHYHFGRGLVPTTSDFGDLGERPTHPELLDWLACELVDHGWSLKHLHRVIVGSEAYRRASAPSASAAERDPGNALWSHFDGRRLSAEELRDSIVNLGGRLDRALGGEPFFEPLPAEVLATSSTPDQVWGASPEEATLRRSLYIKVKRSLAVPLLATFDAADTDSSCPERFATTQPTQALTLLNSEFSARHARAFARRLRDEAGPGARERVRLGLRLALAREPDAAQVERLAAFVDELTGALGLDADTALERFALLAFNLNEFSWVD